MHAGAIHIPSQYSLGSVQPVNGSDQYGGCPVDSVRTADAGSFLTDTYCSNSRGVISDGETMVGDVSRPDWARNLLTIRRESFNTAELAFQFNNEVRMLSIVSINLAYVSIKFYFLTINIMIAKLDYSKKSKNVTNLLPELEHLCVLHSLILVPHPLIS